MASVGCVGCDGVAGHVGFDVVELFLLLLNSSMRASVMSVLSRNNLFRYCWSSKLMSLTVVLSSQWCELPCRARAKHWPSQEDIGSHVPNTFR